MIQNDEIPVRDYKVLVRCCTYNQSKYIEDALNGFVMQKTDFPFACLVIDDASTDGEQEVIKAWMERECDMSKAERYDIPESEVIIVPHKTNPTCTFAFYFLIKNLYGTGKKAPLINHWRKHCEYEAICEGDDYWIAPEKLQKQADYLNEHKECGLVRTEINRYFQEENRFEEKFFTKVKPSNNLDTFEDYVMYGWFAAPCTWMYRISTFRGYPKLDSSQYFSGDLAVILHYAKNSNIHFFNDVTSVYRVLNTSASHFSNLKDHYNFYRKINNLRLYYAKNFNIGFRYRFWKKAFLHNLAYIRSFYIFWWMKDCLMAFFKLI